MPANRASLRVTEAYRAKMVALREQAQREARRVWSQIDQRDLDGTYQVGMLALSVTVLQREAARLSAGYLQAFIQSELGEPVRTPMVDARQVGSARNGDALRKALVSPMITTKVAIKDGKSPPEALVAGRKALERTVGLATDTAARESLRRAMEDSPHVVGWQRAVRGTCGACMGASKGRVEDVGETLHIHPNCQCVSEPMVKPRYGNAKKAFEDIETARSAAELEAFDRYQQVGYNAINGYLRSPELRDIYLDTRPDAPEMIKAMNSGFKKAKPSTEPTELWRGIETPAEELFEGIDDIVGKVIEDPAFSSTSLLEQVGANSAGEAGDLWHLTVRPGVKGIRMTRGIYKGEEEVLLNRGLKYRITGVRREGGRRIIDAEVSK